MLLKTWTPEKAAANLAAYSLSIVTCITVTEKESKLRNGYIFRNSQENVHDIS